MWRLLSSKTVFQHPFMTVIEDEVQLPNGELTTYVRHPNGGRAVMIIVRNPEGLFLVQKEYTHPLQKKCLQFPGGGVKRGESLETAANRELMEESGYRCESIKPLGSFVANNRRSDGRMHVFLGERPVEDKLPGDATEDIETFWVSKQKLEEWIKHGELENGFALAAWLLFRFRDDTDTHVIR